MSDDARAGAGAGAGGPPPEGQSTGSRQGSVTDEARARFRRTLVSVMTVQVAALLLLWLLQARYTP